MSDEIIKIKVREENQTKDEISWQIEERQTNLRNSQWLWALAIVGFAIVVFSILLKNYLLIVIVALTTFIVYAGKFKKPEIHDFWLNSEGLAIDGKLYSYENFESFWIFPAQSVEQIERGSPSLTGRPDFEQELALRRKHHLMPLLIVPFHSREEPEIRKILENYLPESEEEESLLDLLQKKFF